MDVTTLPAPIAAFAVTQRLVDIAKSHPVTCNCATCTEVFDAASEHRYDCKCGACEFWWSRVPPEEDDE